ncbi:universal stress protein [Lewinella sp. IMCC34183]|uniref:universal stress protein n=1 Tax=Lewinella sp. IMCC34183 TaxID=2248762 RepID=UPI000E2859C3|nr:universal stress protein [Lewinella sp. IMCC34183]
MRYDFLVNEALEASDYEKLKGAIAKEIDKKYRSAFSATDCTVETLVREENNSAAAILSARKEYGIDLLVMGKKKKTEGSGHLPFRVINNDLDGTPLWLFPRRVKTNWRHVAAGIDFTPATERTLRSTAALRDLFSARLTFVHVYHLPNAYFPYLRDQDAEMVERVKKAAGKKFSEFRQRVDLDPVRGADFALTAGENVVAALRDYATKNNVDLLVIGRWSQKNLLGSRVGDITRKLMTGGGAQVPLLIV